MKPRNRIFPGLPAVLLPVAMAGSLALRAAPQERPAKQETPQSVFIIPNSPNEGRDPFYPQSTRRYSASPGAVAPNASDSPLVVTDSLALKSIVGGLAIINNHSFAPGEEGDVIDSDGQRQHIRLLEIKSKTKSVVVKIGGQSVELTLQNGL
jgi:hypothetical protein